MSTASSVIRPVTKTIAAIVLIGTGLAWACSGTTDPVTTDVTATLISPNGAEGAVVVELTGVAITGLANDDGDIFSQFDGTTVRIVVVRDDPGDITFRFVVPSPGDRPSGSVIEVAAGNNDLRGSVSGYSLEFTP